MSGWAEVVRRRLRRQEKRPKGRQVQAGMRLPREMRRAHFYRQEHLPGLWKGEGDAEGLVCRRMGADPRAGAERPPDRLRALRAQRKGQPRPSLRRGSSWSKQRRGPEECIQILDAKVQQEEAMKTAQPLEQKMDQARARYRLSRTSTTSWRKLRCQFQQLHRST